MTARMVDIARQVWNLKGKGSARCQQCPWKVDGKQAHWAGRLARTHTRDTGHITRSAHVKVTEYRRLPDGPDG